MFKSSFLRILCPVLLCLFTIRTGISAGIQDTLTAWGTPPDTITRLNSPAFNLMLDGAIRYQHQADSLHRLTIEWRKAAVKMDDPVSRGRLQKKIIQAEDSVGIFQMLANEQWHLLSSEIPRGARKESRHPYLVRDTVLSGITIYKYNLTEEFLERLAEIRKPEDPGMEDPSDSRIPADSRVPAYSQDPAGTRVAGSQDAGFRILEASPYGPGKPFERDFTLPAGVFYRIQIAVFSKDVPPDQFGGLSPITAESVPGKKLTRYFAGKFARMEEARPALKKVKELGYTDAFIVGYYDGKKSSFSRLKVLEK